MEPDCEEMEEIRSLLWPGDDYRPVWATEFLEGLAAKLPDDPRVSGLLACTLTELGRHGEALAADLRTVRLAPLDPDAWYNLGCSYSLLEREGEAERAIERAIALGFGDAGQMEEDDDLAFLRTRPAYARLLTAIRRAAGKQEVPRRGRGPENGAG